MSVEILFAEVMTESNDIGPNKIMTVQSDGKEFDVNVLEQTGVSVGPMKGGQAIIFVPDGDYGRATALSMAPPAMRVDGQKAGEATVKNFTTGDSLKVDNDGVLTINVTGDANINVGADAVIKTGGECHLGGRGGPAVARVGDPTSDGAVIVAGSSKVFSI